MTRLDLLEVTLDKIESAISSLSQEKHFEETKKLKKLFNRLAAVVLDLELADENADEEDNIDVPRLASLRSKHFSRRFNRRKVRNKQIVCCTRPKRRRTKNGVGWLSICRWKAGLKKGSKPVFLRGSKDRKNRPPKSLFSNPEGGVSSQTGKRVQWC